MKRAIFVFVASCAMATNTFGQSMNLAFGPAGQQPSSSYAAAGLAGYWNQLTATHGSTTPGLRDLNGSVTGVSLTQVGGTQLLSFDDPLTTGDAETLMDHCLVTYSATLETCLFINNLQSGTYEVWCYAMMPGEPDVISYTNSEEEAGDPHKIVGAGWPGSHSEFKTYSHHICQVGGNGLLRLHSGIVPGENPADGAAMNGVQIRLIPPVSPADMDCSGTVDGDDIDGFVLALMSASGYGSAYPACNIDNADVSGDGDIDTDDIAAFVAELL